MSDTKKLIASLDDKVEQLLKHIKSQQQILEDKKSEVETLAKRLADKESELKLLKDENEALKNAPKEQKDDSAEMKVRISELVKEIDECISLLKV